MKVDIKGILEGAWNSVFIKGEIEKIAQERITICRGCSLNSEHQRKYNNYKTFRPDFHCTDCGCDLHMKTRCLSCECPKKKWLAHITQEEEFEINRKFEKEQGNGNNKS